MYPVSTLFKTLASAQERRPTALLKLNSVEVQPLQIRFIHDRDSIIGDFSAKSLIVLLDGETPALPAKGGIFECWMGFVGTEETVYLGEFLIDHDDITFDEVKKTYEVVSYDKAINCDVQYRPLTFPATGLQIMTELATRNGLTYVPSTFSTSMDSRSFEFLNLNEDDRISDREVVSRYAQACLAMAVVTPQDELKLIPAFDRTIVDGEIDARDYTDLELDKVYTPYNSFVYEMESVDDPVYAQDVESIDLYGLNEIKVIGNLFLESMTRPVQQEVVDGWLTDVQGLTYYHSFNSTQFISPHFEVGDRIDIKDIEDTAFPTVIQNIEWTWGGGLKGSIAMNQIPETITDYTLGGPEQDYFNMGIRVDRVNRQITSTIELIDENTNKLSEIEQELGSITARVEDIQVGGRNLLLDSGDSVTLSNGSKSYDITQLTPLKPHTVSIVGPAEYSGVVEILIDGILMGELSNNKLTFVPDQLGEVLTIQTTGILEYSEIQLELGNVATDWTPAPEEQEGRVAQLILDSQSLTTILNDLKTDFESQLRYEIKDIDGVQTGVVELGQLSSPFKLWLWNKQISFMQDGVEVAYISDNTMYITDGHFLNSLRVGNFAFQPRANGSLSFGKVSVPILNISSMHFLGTVPFGTTAIPYQADTYYYDGVAQTLGSQMTVWYIYFDHVSDQSLTISQLYLQDTVTNSQYYAEDTSRYGVRPISTVLSNSVDKDLGTFSTAGVSNVFVIIVLQGALFNFENPLTVNFRVKGETSLRSYALTEGALG